MADARERKPARGDAKGASRPPAPFIVGVAGSGTTLLRAALEAHPIVAIPPETHFLADVVEICQTPGTNAERVVELLASEPHWPLFELPVESVAARLPARGRIKPKTALRAFYEAYAQARGRMRWGDETPGYLHSMRLIAQALPESRFVHVVRDPRDVALSQVASGLLRPDAMAAAASQWAREVGRAQRLARRADRYLQLRYEDLREDPEASLGRVCEFCDLPWDPAVERAHHAAVNASLAGQPLPTRPGTRTVVAEPPGRWREVMGWDESVACEAAAGALLMQLGYETLAPRAAAAP